jgi:integrase
MGKLVAKHLGNLSAGMHNDGEGLYLNVRASGSRSWIFRYRDRVTAKLRDKGLGAFPAVTLSAARAEVDKLRSDLRAGNDPIQAKREAVQTAKLEAAKARTFRDCRDAFIKAHKAGWRNAKHGQQWINTLDTHAAALLPLPVQAIDTSLVLGELEPIWSSKTETATRVRQRIEAVLDWATARGYRTGENPARWRGHLQNLLADAAKVKKVVPRAALPYPVMGAFWRELAAVDTLASKALRLQILSAVRPSEATGAHWNEIDLKAKVWTIAGDRMKAGKEHRVPLSAELVAMLEAMPHRKGWVFPGSGRKPGPLTIAATLKLVQELRPGPPDKEGKPTKIITAHGFRSTFRDWAADQTGYPRDVAEMALAHTIKDKSEAAYRRSDMLERRARLMQDWATYCGTLPAKAANVTPIRKGKA